MSEENSSLISQGNQAYGTISEPIDSNDNSINSLNASSTTDAEGIQPSSSDPPTVDTSQSEQMRSTLTLINKVGYGLGHVYNDLCAGVWFSYTLLFMQGALLLPGPEAGALMMLGQVGDALATPIVGYLADRFGTKQKWHVFGKRILSIPYISNVVYPNCSILISILGTGLVFVSFPLIFSLCPMCSTMPAWWRIMYFTTIILTFQLGWAIVQVTHLAIIPEMARTQKDRTELTAMRYSASVVSNVIVFVVTWAVLHINRVKSDSNIGPDDAYRFRVSLIDIL